MYNITESDFANISEHESQNMVQYILSYFPLKYPCIDDSIYCSDVSTVQT